MDYMRPDIVALLRSSDSAYVRELIGMDPVAVFRWATLRAAIQAMAIFAEAGRQRAQKTAGARKGHGPFWAFKDKAGSLNQALTPDSSCGVGFFCASVILAEPCCFGPH